MDIYCLLLMEAKQKYLTREKIGNGLGKAITNIHK